MQKNLFEVNIDVEQQSESIASLSSNEEEIELVCFRDLVPEIRDTNYLTHSVYYYPAKFIPHVVRYSIYKYSEENDIIVDPFAGSGTVGLEAFINKRNAYLLDINLLLNHIVPIKIPKHDHLLDKYILLRRIDAVTKSNEHFIPDWSNYLYWYPQEFFEILSKYWGFIKNAEDDVYTRIIEATLVKLSKHFSYAEHKTPKLFRSKSKLVYVEKLLKTDWLDKLNKLLYSSSMDSLNNINVMIENNKFSKNYVVYHGGVDSASYEYEDVTEFDNLITSPPYMQAQEYIRTSKMDLYWLGYNDKDIKRISSLEIPFRKPDRVISTNTLEDLRDKIIRKDLVAILDSYFCHVIRSLENAMNRLKKGKKACIFIGNPKIDGIEVEIWRIFKEYFIENGFIFENVYEDIIKNRQLFGMRNNKNPEGMRSEFLLVLKKQ